MTRLLVLLVVILTIGLVLTNHDLRTLRDRIDVIDVRRPPLDGYVVEIEVPKSVRSELDACRTRTEHLRLTMETLIRIYPDRRERLPNPPPGWQPWPELGEARMWKGTILAPPRARR